MDAAFTSYPASRPRPFGNALFNNSRLRERTEPVAASEDKGETEMALPE
jgi:hypothetical protein